MKFTVRVESPLHVGAGERLCWLDWFESRGDVHVLDWAAVMDAALFARADAAERLAEFTDRCAREFKLAEEAMDQARGRERDDILRQLRDRTSPLRFARETLENDLLARALEAGDFDRYRAPLAGGRFDRRLEIREQVKDASFAPLLPGSALKGQLRTALLHAALLAPRLPEPPGPAGEGGSDRRGRVLEGGLGLEGWNHALAEASPGRARFSFGDELEALAFRAASGPPKRPRLFDPRVDLLRFLHVSDPLRARASLIVVRVSPFQLAKPRPPQAAERPARAERPERAPRAERRSRGASSRPPTPGLGPSGRGGEIPLPPRGKRAIDLQRGRGGRPGRGPQPGAPGRDDDAVREERPHLELPRLVPLAPSVLEAIAPGSEFEYEIRVDARLLKGLAASGGSFHALSGDEFWNLFTRLFGPTRDEVKNLDEAVLEERILAAVEVALASRLGALLARERRWLDVVKASTHAPQRDFLERLEKRAGERLPLRLGAGGGLHAVTPLAALEDDEVLAAPLGRALARAGLGLEPRKRRQRGEREKAVLDQQRREHGRPGPARLREELLNESVEPRQLPRARRFTMHGGQPGEYLGFASLARGPLAEKPPEPPPPPAPPPDDRPPRDEGPRKPRPKGPRREPREPVPDRPATASDIEKLLNRFGPRR